ncbi:MAG: hypothetical protein GC182_08795 [Rhodopseudomonas sp.]|nr:hypothetical protein [Rhodopseudomonas sp.]
MPQPKTIQAVKALGHCLRADHLTFHGVSSENVCLAAVTDLERLYAALARIEVIARGNTDHDACRVIHEIAKEQLLSK